MYALVDCNNFFVSCERVFRPELLGKPVIVLSNNDGCAVALSNEAKALGFLRGNPYFKIKEDADRHNVYVFSGNHRLYGDMSRRVMTILRSFCDSMTIYSIDEAFLVIPPWVDDMCAYGREIVREVRKSTGIPVSMGLAPTKTLAKVAARFAKKYQGYNGVAMIDTPVKIEKALRLTDIGDVWGIGRRNSVKLRNFGVDTAWDFATMGRECVKNLFTIVGERTWRELNGEDCVPDDAPDDIRKSLTSSRSFSRDVRELSLLKQAMAGFASIVGRKLREQNAFAAEVGVYLCTNRFHEHEPQYYNSAIVKLAAPTNQTTTILEYALRLLDDIYREGFGYKKAGILITHVMARECVNRSLFDDPREEARRERLMKVVDSLNASPGNANCVRLAAMGAGFCDLTRREHASRLYTTRLSDIISIKA